MNTEYNSKRINPPIWQHDYIVLTRLRDILKQFIKCHLTYKGNLLVDYGCGSLPYKDLFLPAVAKYIGVDIGNNKNADILIRESQSLPQKNNSADVVLSTQVLEHVISVNHYLSECHRILKKGGILILSTHGIWPYHGFPDDFHRWTKRGLQAEIEKIGFKCLENRSILGPFASISQYTMLLLAERLAYGNLISKLVLAILSLVGNVYIWIEDKLFPATELSDAANYVICAKKI